MGQKGNDVLELKNQLINRGYYVRTSQIPLTDVFDQETKVAVGKLQQAYQLPQTYIVDPNVVACLSNTTEPTAPKTLLGTRAPEWGMTGPDVIELKKALIQKGYLKNLRNQSVSDRFDDATEQAVKVLQQANKMAATGKVTDEFLKVLR